MKLFVYEHITSGALINELLPPSLAREGNDILQATINDFLQLNSIELTILRDKRLAKLNNHDKIHCHIVDNEEDFQQLYRKTIHTTDFVLPIAPETDNVLSTIQEEILSTGKGLLACQPDATRICGDKYSCYQKLHNANFRTIHTLLASDWVEKQFDASAYIVKPRDGAGCIDSLIFADKTSLSQYLSKQTGNLSQQLVQPYTTGQAISLSVLYSENDSIILAINQQHINYDNGFIQFEGCTVNGITEAQFTFSQAHQLTEQLRQIINGLWGFVGIDLILNDDAATLVDINPRLTTSYVALHQSLEYNPAQLLLNVLNKNDSNQSILYRRKAIKISL